MNKGIPERKEGRQKEEKRREKENPPTKGTGKRGRRTHTTAELEMGAGISQTSENGDTPRMRIDVD